MRFSNLKNLEKDFSVLANPFSVNIFEAPEYLQLELIDLQSNFELKNKFSEVNIMINMLE